MNPTGNFNSNNSLEPRRDLPLHKIPELLAKITGTFSSLNDRREQIFEHYSNRHSLIDINGILRLCNDLNLQPESYEVLLFCFLCRAKQMYQLTKEEFFLGLKNLGNSIDNLIDLRRTLCHFQILPFENEFYMWTFHYGLIDGQRCLTTNNAISLWRLFYSKSVEPPLILDQWLNYLNDHFQNDIPTTITCDTWKIFPQFAKFLQYNGLEAYDDNEGWPCLFDGFVEFYRDKLKSNNSSL